MSDLVDVTEKELWSELQRRQALIQVGYCYPAACTNPAATEMVHAYGYEFGPFQLIEMGEKLACDPQWPVYAYMPEKYRPAALQEETP